MKPVARSPHYTTYKDTPKHSPGTEVLVESVMTGNLMRATVTGKRNFDQYHTEVQVTYGNGKTNWIPPHCLLPAT